MLASACHPFKTVIIDCLRTLKLALIFREVGARMGSPVTASIGAPVSFEQLAGCRSDRALIDELRQRTYALAEDEAPAGKKANVVG
ncbi:hypothetical protein LMG24235_00888 [Paraburkholderia sabiae]|uniref:hypothetical protein n=1 Tax=Paraburkholderia sabiae TaxID=273251 RepID=UPI0019F89E66|nr:hypothetical protein LMG24235_00888 [Paraburkholderia sabiae]